MNYLPYVNIKMGTKSIPRRSYGNTLPLTQTPLAEETQQTDKQQFDHIPEQSPTKKRRTPKHPPPRV